MTEQLPNNQEQAPKQYEAAAQRVLDRIQKLPEGEEARAVTDLSDYIKDVLDVADSRGVQSSQGLFDKTQMIFQFEDYVNQLEKGDAKALTKIPSAEGLRSGVRMLTAHPDFIPTLKHTLQSMTEAPEGVNTSEPEVLPATPKVHFAEVQPNAPEANVDIAAERAQHMIEGINAEVDEHSLEIAEEEPRINAGQAEDIGKEGLEAAEVEEPLPEQPEPFKFDLSPEDHVEDDEEEPVLNGEVDTSPEEFSSQLDQMRATYEVQAAAIKEEVSEEVLGYLISHLDNQVEPIQGFQSKITDSTVETVTQLQQQIYSDNHDLEGVRTLVNQTLDSLNTEARMLYNFKEAELDEMIRLLGAAETKLQLSVDDATRVESTFDQVLRDKSLERPDDVESVQAVVNKAQNSMEGATDVRTLATELGTTTTTIANQFYGVMNYLGDMMNLSYNSHSLDKDEVISALNQLMQLVQSEEFKDQSRAVVQSVSQLQEAMQLAKTTLDERR